jgi:carboxylesterase
MSRNVSFPGHSRSSNEPVRLTPRGGPGQPTKRAGVLLFHGLAGTSAELRLLVNQLQRNGYEVRSPLIEGLGGGTDFDQLLRWQDWVAQAEAAYDELAKECSEVHIGGLCAGALIALKLAATPRAKLGRLLLLGPTLRADGWAIPFSLRLFSLVHARWFARYFEFGEREPFGIKDERIRHIVLEGLKREHAAEEKIFEINGVKLLEFRRLARHVRRRIQDVTAPTLIIHAREDDQSSLANAYRILRKLRGPIEMRVLHDSYHVITLDRQRHDVVNSVVRFLKPHVYVEDVMVRELESALRRA